MKRIAALVLSVILMSTLGGAALGEADKAPAELTSAELSGFIEEVRTRALQEEPRNNPATEEARSEDGYVYVYDFATLTAEKPTLDTSTGIRSIQLSDDSMSGPREIGLDSDAEAVLSAFASDNPTLDGTRERALIYLRGTAEAGFRFGHVIRDGQRIQVIEYGEVYPGEIGGFGYDSLLYTLTDGLVTEIRAYRQKSGYDAAQALSLYEELEAAGRGSGYTRVASSRNGLELTAFGEEDLIFQGLDFLRAQPGDLPGMPEDVLMDNEDGSWLRLVDGDGYSAVFLCNQDGKNAELNSFTILSDTAEGPRGVRLGDLFHEDFTRFRNGENETDGVREVLYGTEGVPPYGIAEYADGDGMTLRYVAAVGDGQAVELYLHYVDNTLNEIIVHKL